MQVQDLLIQELITLRRDDPAAALLRILEETNQDVFPVLDQDGRVVGTIGELDLIRTLRPTARTFAFGPRKLVREGVLDSIEDIMTPRPSTARPDEAIETALHRMASLSLTQLVVVDAGGRLLGILRGRDIYRALAAKNAG